MGVATRPAPVLERTGTRYGGDVLLEIEDLEIHFETSRGIARVVDGASLTVNRNEIVGIAGESGSGKTTLVEAVLQIIRFPNRVARGSVRFYAVGRDPVDLMRLSKEEMRRFRWEQISYIPQGSMNSLTPTIRLRAPIADEPTTALDVNVQRIILETLSNLRREFKIAILIVSHDLPVHAQLADRIG